MVDSFFIDPAARKRKRENAATRAKRPAPAAAVRENKTASDDEITSDSDLSIVAETDTESEDEYAHETEADKRRRLAKEYLETLQEELGGGSEAFDAKDLDREIISKRLKEDVAEQEGRVYRYLEKHYNFHRLGADDDTVKTHSVKPYALTSVAVHYPFAYTTSKDLTLSKWNISDPKYIKLVRYVKGDRREKKKQRAWKEEPYQGHFDEILCIAVNHNGNFIATGGRDRRIVIWSSESMSPLKVLETKDRKGSVLGLVFRRNTNELYASCADLKVRTYNIDQLTQVETLFGHQDQVADISALNQEKCVTVGGRDRTTMLWKISEESRLIFRGGDTKRLPGQVMEGSIDCISMVDDQTFVTGSDNGSISLWSTNKKRPIFVLRESHGREDALTKDMYSAETAADEVAKISAPEPQPRYVTSIYAIPYSNIFLSGSWSGDIKIWRLSDDLRSFELLSSMQKINGVVNKIDAVEHDDKLIITAAVSKEMRLGRWIKARKGKNGIVVGTVYKK